MIIIKSTKLKKGAKNRSRSIPWPRFKIVFAVVICPELNNGFLCEGCLLSILINKNLFS